MKKQGVMERVLSLVKRNKVLGLLIKFIFFVGMHFISIGFEICGWLRSHNIGGKKYKKLKNYYHKHNEERCFIVATGPSLTMKDLDNLKKEVTFGMNSLCKIYKDTDFRPTYYGIQDYLAYDELKSFIHEEYDEKDNIFVSERITRKFKDCRECWNVFPINYAYNAYNRWFNNIFKAKVSDDIYRMVYEGFSITISLLQIAMYMGFKEIYLIGADCDFDKNNLHFVNYEKPVDPTLDTLAERTFAGYRAIEQYALKHGISIYNATRGGRLEIFERVNIDEIL